MTWGNGSNKDLGWSGREKKRPPDFKSHYQTRPREVLPT